MRYLALAALTSVATADYVWPGPNDHMEDLLYLQSGFSRFGAALRRTDLPLRHTDARHLDGITRLTRGAQTELGPSSEVVGELRERLEFDPSHPDADADGYVHYPDVNVVDEMARMISANRVYEANLTSVKAAKEMIKRSLEI